MALTLPDNRLEYPGLLVPGRKPTVPVRIDRSHPIGKKIRYCNIFSKLPLDLHAKRLASMVGNANIDNYGLSLDGAGDYVIADADFDLFGELTAFIVATPSASGSSSYPAFIGRGDTASNEWMLRWWKSDNTLRIYGHSGALNAQSASNTIIPDVDQSVAIRNIYGNGWDALHNGIVVAADTSAAFGIFDNKQIQIGCADGDTLRYYTGGIKLVYGFSCALSDAEIMSLHLNPYQFLVPA